MHGEKGYDVWFTGNEPGLIQWISEESVTNVFIHHTEFRKGEINHAAIFEEWSKNESENDNNNNKDECDTCGGGGGK